MTEAYTELLQENSELGAKILRLEQENKELKETVKDLNQSIQNCNIQRTKMYKALEEIKKYIVDELCGYYHSKKDDYNEILEKIESIIDEVLTNEN